MTDTALDPYEKALERSGRAFSWGGISKSPLVADLSPTYPDPEVTEKPKRRRFTAEYKLRILREADRCSKPGELGALLRQEGLYSSNLTTWKRQQDERLLHALTPKKRGRKGHKPNPLARRVAELERQNQQLSQRLKQAEIIIEAQKKISQLLGSPLNAPENGGNK